MNLPHQVKQGKLVYLSNDVDKISVSENEYYRWLAFDDTIQSVMHKRIPSKLTLPHQYAMLIPLIFFKPQKVLELGLGGGNLNRFILEMDADIEMTSVELNSHVIECFHQYFNPTNTSINIENNSALDWLEQQKNLNISLPDWQICDVYQHHGDSFHNRIALISALVDNLAIDGCLTINLPDLSDDEVNLCITILQQLQNNHQIIYFHIPRYLNIVVHLLPKHWQLQNVRKQQQNTYLSIAKLQRWKKIFTYHKTAN